MSRFPSPVHVRLLPLTGSPGFSRRAGLGGRFLGLLDQGAAVVEAGQKAWAVKEGQAWVRVFMDAYAGFDIKASMRDGEPCSAGGRESPRSVKNIQSPKTGMGPSLRNP